METNWVDNTAVSCHGYVFIYPGCYKRLSWKVSCYSLKAAIFFSSFLYFFLGKDLLKLLPETKFETRFSSLSLLMEPPSNTIFVWPVVDAKYSQRSCVVAGFFRGVKWDLPSSGMLRRVEWYCVTADVLGESIGPFRGSSHLGLLDPKSAWLLNMRPKGWPEKSVTNFHYALRKMP